MMEDHRDAYFLWQKMGISAASCLHIDAHLDMAGFQAPRDGSLSRPEINCANYLLKAVEEGMVQRVVWVIPPHLITRHKNLLDWLYHELPNWLPLTLTEHNSFKVQEGRAEGLLRGASLTVCTPDHLPDLSGPWLLDLDVDYFLDEEDHVWQTPFRLHEILPRQNWQAITIAYSVLGGYTPLARRYLGDLSHLLWRGKEKEAETWWRDFQSLSQLDQAPLELQAAALVCRAWGSGSDHEGEAWNRAQELVPAYRVEPSDIAAMYWQRKRFSRCIRWTLRDPGPGSQYLQGFVAFEQGRFAEAARCWESLLTQTEQPGDEISRRHLNSLIARCWRRARKNEKARNSLEAALTLRSPDRIGSAELHRELARLHREEGQWEAAAQHFRKAINLAPDLVDNLEAQVELAELYIEMEQMLRAQGEYRKLAGLELPGNLRIRAERIPVKIALRNRLPRPSQPC